MEKIRVLICFAILLVSSTTLSGREYYVAPSGKDSNPGSLEQPFASIQHAVSFLKAGDILYLREGRYHEEVQISGLIGQEGQPIIIQAFEKEKVIVDGSVAITSEWSRYKDQIFRTRINHDIWQLFVNGETMISARWPNAAWRDGSIWDQEKTWGHQYDDSKYGNFINDPLFQDLAGTGVDFTGAVVMLNIGAWITYATKVESHQAGSDSFTYARNLWDRLENEVYWEHRALETGWYFFEGTLEMLDTAGEWAYQADTGYLYFWPFENNFPENLDIRGKTLTYALAISNSKHVLVKGLDFFATTFHIDESKNVAIEDCDFMYPSYSKRMLGVTDAPEVTTVNGSENTVRNCSFGYTDGEGLVIQGEKNLIENCHFHNINYSCIGSAVTVDAARGLETIFRHNTMHTGGASVGYRSGTRNIIEYNRIYDIGYLQTDGALLQFSGSAQTGTIIRYNWLHNAAQASRFDDDPKFGIRFDGSYPGYLLGVRDLPHGGTVHHNVVFDTRGMYIKGDDHRVFNNLAFDNLRNDLAVRSGTGRGVTRDPMQGYTYDGWGPGIEHPGENDNSITRNNLAGQISSNLRIQSIGLPGKNSNNWAGDIRSQLRDPDNLDFRQSLLSQLTDAGYFVEGVTEEYLGRTPDIGPYEKGANNYWIPGRKLVEASTPIPPAGSTTVKQDCSLMWLEGYKAAGHEVYLGTSWKSVAQANPGSKEYKGMVKTNMYEPGNLKGGTTYYWRVDVLSDSGKIKGKVWSFSVER